MWRHFSRVSGGETSPALPRRVVWLLPLGVGLLFFLGGWGERGEEQRTLARRSADSGKDARPRLSVLPPAAQEPSDRTRAPFQEADELSRPGSQDEYLRRLDALSVSDKPQALAYAQAGEHWFGETGVEAEARRAKSITLLVDLGRMDEARQEVRSFIARHPESRYRPLVQGVTGIHPRPTRSDYQ